MVEILIIFFVLTGSLFILIASLGMHRFKDVYGRIHAATKATSFGVLLLLVGVSIFFQSWSVALKSLLVIMFVYITAPLAAHSIAVTIKKKDKGNPGAPKMK
ncbi:MAG: monovalent cation/H(+) antiporter subunit G [Bacteroidales bacterium]|nr:monovalent cation/H(+) antiporter subunit G [Bacteroidales bacterium]